MCNVISNRVIIGNYLIESIKKDSYDFSFEEFNRFDEILSSKLQVFDCYSSFDEDGINEFIEDYPFVIKHVSDTKLSIIYKENKERLLEELYRYFRIGISKRIAQAIAETSDEYWGEDA